MFSCKTRGFCPSCHAKRRFNSSLLSELCVCGKEALIKYLEATTEKHITPGIIAVITLCVPLLLKMKFLFCHQKDGLR